MERGKVNPVSVFMALLIVAGLYLSYKYVPIVWTHNELSTLVREACFSAGRSSDGEVRSSLVEATRLDLELDIKGKDIEVARYTNRVRVDLIWRPVITFPFGKSIQHKFTISESATTY